MTLSKELAKQIAKNIGANPVSIGKIGLTIPELLTKSQLKISDEDGVIKYSQMWYGEIKGSDNIVCCLLSLLEQEPFEICSVIMFKDFSGDITDNAIGFGYSHDNESFLLKIGERWLPMTMAQKLQLALGVEVMVQDGLVWNCEEMPEEIKKNLSEIISIDE
jgi:hypothetical protein